MSTPRAEEIITEAKVFRLKLDLHKRSRIQLITEDFPINNCKLASLLFTYHALQKWPSLVISGVGGIATNHNGENLVSHYWLEYQDMAIDITADQYNIIEDRLLNSKIIHARPFQPVSTGKIGAMQNYNIFEISYRDTYTYGLPELAEDFLNDLQDSHASLEQLGLGNSTSSSTTTNGG